MVAHTLVDDADFEALTRWTWRLTSHGYVVRGRGGRYRMHRVILGLAPDDPLEGEHKDGDRLNNQRANLRTATRSENNQNRRTWGSVPYRGVDFHVSGRYRARAQVAGKVYNVGYYKTPEAAAQAAAAFRASHMPFAR